MGYAAGYAQLQNLKASSILIQSSWIFYTIYRVRMLKNVCIEIWIFPLEPELWPFENFKRGWLRRPEGYATDFHSHRSQSLKNACYQVSSKSSKASERYLPNRQTDRHTHTHRMTNAANNKGHLAFRPIGPTNRRTDRTNIRITCRPGAPWIKKQLSDSMPYRYSGITQVPTTIDSSMQWRT